jgi:hypothetical protein
MLTRSQQKSLAEQQQAHKHTTSIITLFAAASIAACPDTRLQSMHQANNINDDAVIVPQHMARQLIRICRTHRTRPQHQPRHTLRSKLWKIFIALHSTADVSTCLR